MEFRRNESNERRRRVLKDDATATTDEAADAAAPRRSRAALGKRYSEAALEENQPRVTDFVAVRWWKLTLLLAGILILIVGVQSLHIHAPGWSAVVGDENLVAFDPNQRGSLAAWFSSMLLGLAAVKGFLIFSIRRHKVDDYRGRYRLWLPVSALLILASIDAGTGLHRAARGLLLYFATQYLPESSLARNHAEWQTALAGALFLAVAVRLAIEMRGSPTAVSWLTLAAVGYLTTGLVEFNVIKIETANVVAVVSSSARLIADWALLSSVVFYSRYIYLDSQGILAARAVAREKKRKAASAAAKEAAKEKEQAREAAAFARAAKAESSAASPAVATAKRTDLANESKPEPLRMNPSTRPENKPAPPLKVPSIHRDTANVDEEDDADEDEEGDSSHSRTERKRLKKLARREIRKAA